MKRSGAAILADTLLHKVTTVLVPMYWLVFVPKGGLDSRDGLLWCLLPAGYVAYTLARGEVEASKPILS